MLLFKTTIVIQWLEMPLSISGLATDTTCQAAQPLRSLPYDRLSAVSYDNITPINILLSVMHQLK